MRSEETERLEFRFTMDMTDGETLCRIDTMSEKKTNMHKNLASFIVSILCVLKFFLAVFSSVWNDRGTFECLCLFIEDFF